MKAGSLRHRIQIEEKVVELDSEGERTEDWEDLFGLIPAEVATNLSLVFTEVVQNALEHGLGEAPGEVVVRAGQRDGQLVVEVENDGTSLPDDFSVAASGSLGLSIVTTLVADLDGTFEMAPRPSGGGSRARIVVPLA